MKKEIRSTSAKLFTVLTVFIINSVEMRSQDTLILSNGTKIASKISEISSSEIKYKKSDNLDGPTFITSKSEVAIIKYQNGTSDTLRSVRPKVAVVSTTPSKPAVVETPKLYPVGSKYMLGDMRISENEMYKKALSMNNPELSQYVRKAKVGKSGRYIGFVAIPALAGGLGYMIYTAVSGIGSGNGPVNSKNDYTPAVPFLALGVACLATSIVFTVQYKHNNVAVVKLYNEKY